MSSARKSISLANAWMNAPAYQYAVTAVVLSLPAEQSFGFANGGGGFAGDLY